MYSIEGVPVNNINGHDVVTLEDFSKLIHRAVSTVRRLVSIGNRYRKLKTLYVGTKPFIPISELFDFPFTMQGRSEHLTYQFRLENDNLKIVHAKGYCGEKFPVQCDRKCDACISYMLVNPNEMERSDDEYASRLLIEDPALSTSD